MPGEDAGSANHANSKNRDPNIPYNGKLNVVGNHLVVFFCPQFWGISEMLLIIHSQHALAFKTWRFWREKEARHTGLCVGPSLESTPKHVYNTMPQKTVGSLCPSSWFLLKQDAPLCFFSASSSMIEFPSNQQKTCWTAGEAFGQSLETWGSF